jgi:virginiamycin A acetyltransferase
MRINIKGILKHLVKRVLLALGVILVLPLIALNWFEYWLSAGKSERFYILGKELLSVFPTFVGEFLRLSYYCSCCSGVSPDVCFMLGSVLAHREVVIGSGTVIGYYSIIGKAEIGENVLIAPHVSVLSGKYQQGQPSDRREGKFGEGYYQTVHIGRNSWIGQCAIIMAEVGENCTVGSGSVVCKKVEDNTTVMGNPARKVSY